MPRWFATFFAGGIGYNAAVCVLGLVGVGLGAWALCIAYRQLRRVARATEAAKEAAENSRERVLGMTGLLSLTELCTYARDVQASVLAASYKAASLRASDLRSGIRKTRMLCARSNRDEDKRWRDLISKIASLHDELGRITRTDDPSPGGEQLTKLANKVSDILNDIAAETAGDLGAD